MSSQRSQQELVSRKKFLQTLAAAGAVGAAGLAISGSVISPVHAALADVDTASFIIDNESGTINAYSGNKGNVVYSGTDASAVIQSAINALPSAGGVIFLREGTFPITTSAQTPVGIPSGVVLQGAGRDTTTITSPQGFFYGRYVGTPTPASQVSNIAIRDMTLQSNAPSGGGVGTGGYLFNASYGANALRFERLKLLGGGNVGTGVFGFLGTGGTGAGNYSNIQFIDVWADTQGTTSGNELFIFSEYNISNIKFSRCYVKNTSGPNLGFFQIGSASNVSLRDCTLDTGGVYMGVFGTTLPVTGRLIFDGCNFLNWGGFGTGGSSIFQYIEVIFRGCISETPFVPGGDGIYHVYLSDSWVLGNRPFPASSGYIATSGNITIRGGGLADGWNSANTPWYKGGGAMAIPTSQPALSQLLVDISGFRIGTPASGSAPAGIGFNYVAPPPPQNLRLKIVDSFMSNKLIYSAVLNGLPTGFVGASGTNWLNQLVNTGFMPTQHTLIGFTDETGNRYAYPQGIATINVGSSPFTYQNMDGVPEAIYIVGGIISQVAKIDAQSPSSANLFTTTNVTVWLEPGESVAVTYSSTPAMFKDRK